LVVNLQGIVLADHRRPLREGRLRAVARFAHGVDGVARDRALADPRVVRLDMEEIA
jgi:acyl-coenzyme A thioesterase PaaI-like protein